MKNEKKSLNRAFELCLKGYVKYSNSIKANTQHNYLTKKECNLPNIRIKEHIIDFLERAWFYIENPQTMAWGLSEWKTKHIFKMYNAHLIRR